ncbi:MAG: hypothetical protein AAF191_11545, partial [Verrucomicrobiota bacterium]
MTDSPPPPPPEPGSSASDNPFQPPKMPNAEADKGFSDMKTLILVMGILTILGAIGMGCGGGFYGFFFPQLIAEMPEESREGMDEPWMTAVFQNTGLLLLVFAGGLIWLGIGAIRTKKWAGDLYLSGGWMYGAIMLVSTLAFVGFLPGMFSGMEAAILGDLGEEGELNAEEMFQAMRIGMFIGVA